jgi:hypothetical protein
MKRMQKSGGIVLSCVLLLACGGAMAQDATVRRACGAELQQYCAGVSFGEGRLRNCVKQHFAAFSEPCKQILLSSVAVVRACKEDVQKTCAGIEPGGGRIQACMKDHFTEYSEPCKNAILTAKFGRR